MTPKYGINDIVEMKKQHACGTNRFKIIRMGADIRIKCENCQRSIMIPRQVFDKNKNISISSRYRKLGE